MSTTVFHRGRRCAFEKMLVAGIVAFCCAPRWAAAQPPPPASEPKDAASAAPPGSISLSALLGYGAFLGAGLPVFSEYGLGYGVRAGYTWGGTPLYLGGTGLGYQGGASDTEDVDIFMLDIELGYEFGAGPLVLRPYLGLGAAAVLINLTERSAPGARAGSGITLHVSPGLLASYALGPMTFGVEARYARMLEWPDALSLLGSAGVAF